MTKRLSVIEDVTVVQPFVEACAVKGMMPQEGVDGIAQQVAGRIFNKGLHRESALLIFGLRDIYQQGGDFRQMRDHLMHMLRRALGWGRFCVATDERQCGVDNVNKVWPVSNPGGVSLVARENVKLKGDAQAASAFESFLEFDGRPDCFPDVTAYDPYTGMTLVERMDMRVCQDLVKRELAISFKDLIGLFLDYIEGVIYLAEKKLVLADICPYNLGIGLGGEKLRGVFHDLETMVHEGYRQKSRPHHDGYWPVDAGERYGHDLLNPIRKEEMVYQLGISLRDLCAFVDPGAKKAELTILVEEMTRSIDERIDMYQVQQVLRMLYDGF